MTALPDAPAPAVDDLTDEERSRVAPYVTSTTAPVFALRGLPESVKGALFARYSRSAKSLRRILLDEFMPDDVPRGGESVGSGRADAFYGRVLSDYGDDSVAQLGAAHVAVEGASNLLTKVLEWGRLGSYLEQSTRYIPYDDRPGGEYRYHRPSAVIAHPDLGPRYVRDLDTIFGIYAALIPPMIAHVDGIVPRAAGGDQDARSRAVRARALDAIRGLLPAATRSNVGIFASGQAFEAMLIRMAAHPLAEARACAALMLGELRFVIPAFLTRVDRPDRGHVHGAYLTAFAEVVGDECARVVGPAEPVQAPASVRLVDFDVDGEARVLAHALWPASGRPIDDVRRAVDALDEDGRARLLTTLAGERADRRHRPGRWLEATTYAFEIVCDYGAYRDLQRHRLLSLQAQDLTPSLGYDVPQDVPDTACVGEYMRAMETSAGLYDALRHEIPGAASYAVSMAHRVRFTMVMNAREAMHVIELRSQPQGHETYRAVAQEMHRLIAGHAGHRTIAAMMRFVDHRGVGAGRLDAEARAAARGSTAEVQ